MTNEQIGEAGSHFDAHSFPMSLLVIVVPNEKHKVLGVAMVRIFAFVEAGSSCFVIRSLLVPEKVQFEIGRQKIFRLLSRTEMS